MNVDLPEPEAARNGSGQNPPEITSRMIDDQVRSVVLVELRNSDWTRSMQIDVHVDDGIVTLRGSVPSAAIRDAAGWVARQAPRVRAVVNALSISPSPLPPWG